VDRSVASRGVASGTLICESLRVGAVLDAVVLTVSAIERVAPTNLSAGQREAGIPERWTLVHFEVEDEHASRLADALAELLDDPGWYADLHTAHESFVVFAGRVFRYRSGDASGRAEAEAHARAHGVPDAQIDWP
jgi:AcrR family transcriptional regulator